MPTPPLIYLHWQGACYTTEDTAHSELGSLQDLWEIGFLLKETADAYVLSSEYQPDATSSRLTLTVPKINVLEAKIIQPVALARLGKKVRNA